MISNLFRSISKHTDRGPNQDCPQGYPQGEADRTEDGFLLVGDTASERATVRADCFQSDQIDAPPTYAGGVQGLPSYTEYRSNMKAYASPTVDVNFHPDIPHGNPMQTGTPTITTGVNYGAESVENHSTGNADFSKTAISDIPFHLGCSVGGSLVLQDIKQNNLLLHRSFDVSKYEYDFTTELAFLREHELFDDDNNMDTSS